MIRHSTRERGRALEDLNDGTSSPPTWFREWYADRSESWRLEEWRQCVRRARERGTDLSNAAWMRNLRRFHDNAEDGHS